ncbi:acyl transferase/acyl hydrolase/lysophospholipase [Desarmillaria tabescens]|uniref:Acyl transferase/acyl hydrolase/lysophospholipase n=1 Tax=Armillaria tabescens TaxID=1929756 RepID=A0AA39JNK5_ARMTA|nr:acyl transferase/acyl hydrolase/lysophospholipase [Desarmillaria tabescens]KAK0446050.1 acyl transferase/acyl hydrolase/lysophospholipase [Desarmillaria tabescens]
MVETHGGERGLRLLSIDGGGIRGLSALYILQNLMWRIRVANGLEQTPKPCEYFDLLGGTNTGGLIVLMLGRLQMSVDETIDRWSEFCEKVFGDTKGFGRDGKYKASTFEDILKSIVRDHTEPRDPETEMMEKDAAACKTFVCAMNAHNMNALTPVLFRTYDHPKEAPKACKVWEAGRATCAMPVLFKRIEIGPKYRKQPYIDGGMGRNNPAKVVLDEARVLYPAREVACLTSIGTGYPKTIAVTAAKSHRSSSVEAVDEALVMMATDCEGTAQDLAKQYRDTPDVYFRLNVQRGMEQITPEQWDRFSEVGSHTDQYLKDENVEPNVEKVVKILGEGGPNFDISIGLC